MNTEINCSGQDPKTLELEAARLRKLTFETFFRVFDLLSVASGVGTLVAFGAAAGPHPARSLLGEGESLPGAVPFLVKAGLPARAALRQGRSQTDRSQPRGARKGLAHLRHGHGWQAAGWTPASARCSSSCSLGPAVCTAARLSADTAAASWEHPFETGLCDPSQHHPIVRK